MSCQQTSEVIVSAPCICFCISSINFGENPWMNDFFLSLTSCILPLKILCESRTFWTFFSLRSKQSGNLLVPDNPILLIFRCPHTPYVLTLKIQCLICTTHLVEGFNSAPYPSNLCQRFSYFVSIRHLFKKWWGIIFLPRLKK